MGKLGKKARKFAKKNLQSVLKKQRKTKSFIKKKSTSRDGKDVNENQVEDTTKLHNGRIYEGVDEISLDAIFSEEDIDVVKDESDTEGYLSEDSSCPQIGLSENQKSLVDSISDSALSTQQKEMRLELAKQKKKLDKLKKKDPEFLKFLESCSKQLEAFRDEDIISDEDEISEDDAMQSADDSSKVVVRKLLTNSVIHSWFQLVREQQSLPALTSLINGYRAACHHGTESSDVLNGVPSHRFQNSDAFTNIIIFMLREADNIFRGLLGISSSNHRKESILELKKTPRWKNARPLIKSYLRSTLFLLNQVANSELLAFSLSRLRASIILFAAFPFLLQRLLEVAVQLWASGDDNLSSQSFIVIRDVVIVFSPEYFDTCFIQMYKALVACCKVVDPLFFKRLEFMRNSFVELCSLDVQKSSSKALLSIQQLSRMILQGLRTKKKDTVKKICSWEYIFCIEIWVMFISANVRDCELRRQLFMMVQVTNGVIYLFPGPRYLPLRLKCVQWLNLLSSSSRIFIPVASFLLDALEYKVGKEGRKHEKAFNHSTAIKLPKHLMKSHHFQQECVVSAIELLSVHFAQWSYHISFPELATIPLIRLKKFYETSSIESFGRLVKRFIDQVEQNVEYVQKKRDEVAFSPKDHESVENFLQLEKSSGNHPFTQYYKNLIAKAVAGKNLITVEKKSLPDKKKSEKRKKHSVNPIKEGANNVIDSKKSKLTTSSVDGEKSANSRKKVKT